MNAESRAATPDGGRDVIRRAADRVSSADADASRDATRVMDSLRRVVHALRVATRASERSFGLSAAQLFVLRQIALAPGVSMTHLARRTRTTQSSVSEVVARLVRRGFVDRHPAASDRRRAQLSLTPAGTALLDHAPESVQERLLAGLARLSEADRRALADGMEAWLAASGLEAVAPVLFFEEPQSSR